MSIKDCNTDKKNASFRSLHVSDWILLTVLMLSNASAPMAFSCIAPFYNHVAFDKGMSLNESGIVFGVFNLLSCIASPFIGKFIPIFGTKKLFSFGLLFSTIGTFAFAFTIEINDSDIFFYTSVLLRLLQSLGNAMYFTCTFAIVTKKFPELSSSMLGLTETCAGIGFTLGPLFGGILYDVGGYKLPFFIIGLLLACNVIVSYFYIIDEDTGECEENTSFGFKELFSIRDIWFMFISVFLVGVLLAVHDPTLPVAVESFNYTHSQIGLIFLIIGGSYSCFAPLLGTLIDKYMLTNYLLIIGNIGLIISCIILAPAPFLPFELNIYSISISLFLQGVSAAALFVPCFKQCIYIVVKEHNYPDDMNTSGVVSGTFAGSFYLGAFLGPTIGAFLVETFGYSTAIMIFGTFSTIYYILFIILYLIPRYIKSKQTGQVNISEYEKKNDVSININDIKNIK
ncbi:MFS-type transporter SLC18B1 [Strongyloides ratti]|uniref:MFS-type transporter SLC18B1 n=1 Tax=Strongyloides ratti TaxID=34506 RepID=A0A090LA22_STRRB|nr:MFS-type transporter SLC18B1 [Strongyloides ratti]CEF64355.1 MFS-type transporter SLC18B1 [Strongyloides ratti]